MRNGVLTRTLLILLLCSLITVAGCYVQMGPGFAMARYQRTVQLSEPMAAGCSFAAKTNDGWIIVNGRDVTDCNVTATVIARANSDKNARRIAEDTRLSLERFGNRLTLRVERPMLMTNQSVDVQFKAMVPETCNVELGTDDGDITIENINGSIDARTDDGTVTLSAVKGVMKVKTDDGSIHARKVAGDAEFETDDGKITVSYLEEADGVCSVSLIADDGSIDFTAPSGFSAQVQVSTDDGSIHTDLPIQVRGKLHKDRIEGTIGLGEGKLHVRTDDGSIRIR
jgi:hypothetical protein